MFANIKNLSTFASAFETTVSCKYKERKNNLNFFLKKLAELKIRVTFATPFKTTVMNVEKKFEKS